MTSLMILTPLLAGLVIVGVTLVIMTALRGGKEDDT